jgi:xanthine dehydrogenase molybdenum-binding subunit
MDSVKAQLEWNQPKEEGEGVGMASLIHVGGGARVYKSDGCGTIIKMDDFAKIDLFTGATDMGQGSDTVVAQIVAEELGLEVEDIHVIHTDTDVCPWDVGAHASRTTFVAGNAALGAARKLKARILELGAKQLEAPMEKLVLRDRHLIHQDDPEKKLEIGKLLRKSHFSHGGQMLMAEYFYDPANEH